MNLGSALQPQSLKRRPIISPVTRTSPKCNSRSFEPADLLSASSERPSSPGTSFYSSPANTSASSNRTSFSSPAATSGSSSNRTSFSSPAAHTTSGSSSNRTSFSSSARSCLRIASRSRQRSTHSEKNLSQNYKKKRDPSPNPEKPRSTTSKSPLSPRGLLLQDRSRLLQDRSLLLLGESDRKLFENSPKTSFVKRSPKSTSPFAAPDPSRLRQRQDSDSSQTNSQELSLKFAESLSLSDRRRHSSENYSRQKAQKRKELRRHSSDGVIRRSNSPRNPDPLRKPKTHVLQSDPSKELEIVQTQLLQTHLNAINSNQTSYSTNRLSSSNPNLLRQSSVSSQQTQQSFSSHSSHSRQIEPMSVSPQQSFTCVPINATHFQLPSPRRMTSPSYAPSSPRQNSSMSPTPNLQSIPEFIEPPKDFSNEFAELLTQRVHTLQPAPTKKLSEDEQIRMLTLLARKTQVNVEIENTNCRKKRIEQLEKSHSHRIKELEQQLSVLKDKLEKMNSRVSDLKRRDVETSKVVRTLQRAKDQNLKKFRITKQRLQKRLKEIKPHRQLIEKMKHKRAHLKAIYEENLAFYDSVKQRCVSLSRRASEVSFSTDSTSSDLSQKRKQLNTLSTQVVRHQINSSAQNIKVELLLTAREVVDKELTSKQEELVQEEKELQASLQKTVSADGRLNHEHIQRIMQLEIDRLRIEIRKKSFSVNGITQEIHCKRAIYTTLQKRDLFYQQQSMRLVE